MTTEQLPAEAALAAASQRHAKATAALAEAEQEAQDGAVNGRPVPSLGKHRAALADAEGAVNIAQSAVKAANRKRQEEEAASRLALRDVFKLEQVEAVRALDRALTVAAKANAALLDVQQRAATELGPTHGLEALHLAQLLEESSNSDTLIAAWRRATTSVREDAN